MKKEKSFNSIVKHDSPMRLDIDGKDSDIRPAYPSQIHLPTTVGTYLQ
jgi:hypothetical protein